MTDWTPEEDEAFNDVEKHSNLGKQILRDIEGQPYHFEKRTWIGLTEDEAFACQGRDYFETYKAIEAKLKEKNE